MRLTSSEEYTCKKCGEPCVIDGEYPRFDCWCDTCNDYAKGFDCLDYAANFIADRADYWYDKIRDEGL